MLLRLVAIALSATLLAAPALSVHDAAERVIAPGPLGADVSGENALVETIGFSTDFPLRHAEDARKVAARDHLAARLAAMGFEVIVHEYRSSMGVLMGANVLGLLRGDALPHDWIVVSAHYDTVPETEFGTWDDGAGVGALLELGRVAAQRDRDRTLVIAFFDDEEQGLVGSARFVQEWEGRAWSGGHVRLVAGISLDPPGLNWPCPAVGYQTTTTLPFSYFQRAPNTPGGLLLRSFAEEAALEAGVPPESLEFTGSSVNLARVMNLGLGGTSDNAAFGARGVPDLWRGGTTHIAFHMGNVRAEALRYPLHTPADNPATLLATCPGKDPETGRLFLARGFEVAILATLGTVERVDAHAGAFPKP